MAPPRLPMNDPQAVESKISPNGATRFCSGIPEFQSHDPTVRFVLL
jgi:hypothetical protein